MIAKSCKNQSGHTEMQLRIFHDLKDTKACEMLSMSDG